MNIRCKKLKSFLEVFYIILGVYLISLGTNIFLLPHKMTTGGASGIATILYYVFNIPMGLSILIINLPLFIQGYLAEEIKSTVKCHFLSDIELFAVYGSKLDLALLIDNFVKNSEDWHAKNIWLHCSRQNNSLQLDIYDDGDGLIDSFSQEPNQIFDFAKSGRNGTGFGMYLIKETLKSLRASIEIDTPINNKGMHFKILFK